MPHSFPAPIELSTIIIARKLARNHWAIHPYLGLACRDRVKFTTTPIPQSSLFKPLP